MDTAASEWTSLFVSWRNVSSLSSTLCAFQRHNNPFPRTNNKVHRSAVARRIPNPDSPTGLFKTPRASLPSRQSLHNLHLRTHREPILLTAKEETDLSMVDISNLPVFPSYSMRAIRRLSPGYSMFSCGLQVSLCLWFVTLSSSCRHLTGFAISICPRFH